MNERILEIHRQVMLWSDTPDCPDTIEWCKGQIPEEYTKKFAELIVEECINRIEQNRSSGENTDSWTITRDMAFHQMKEDLKRHFGVE